MPKSLAYLLIASERSRKVPGNSRSRGCKLEMVREMMRIARGHGSGRTRRSLFFEPLGLWKSYHAHLVANCPHLPGG